MLYLIEQYIFDPIIMYYVRSSCSHNILPLTLLPVSTLVSKISAKPISDVDGAMALPTEKLQVQACDLG